MRIQQLTENDLTRVHEIDVSDFIDNANKEQTR